MVEMRTIATLAASLLSCAVAGCGSSEGGDGGAGGTGGAASNLGFMEHPCEAEIPAGFTDDDVRCGSLTALQDRDDPDGPTLTVEFAVVLARQSPGNPDPFVYVPGGPGSEAIDAFFALDANDLLKTVNESRDLVYFDPRGTGRSTPDMRCPERLERANAAYFEPGGAVEDGAARLDGMRDCYDRLTAAGIDLDDFNSQSISADLAEGLQALGYERANFWAESYGGRLIQSLMRDSPELVRSVILDAPIMPDIRATKALNFQQSLDALLADCAASPTCDAAYPDLEDQFYSVVESLNETPAVVNVEFRGDEVTVYVSGDRFVAGLQNALNVAGLIPLIPASIRSTFEGDLGIVQTVAPGLLSAFDSIAWGHGASVDCSENAPFWTEAERNEDNADVDPLIVAALAPINEGVDVVQCDFWNVEPQPAIEGEPLVSDIPALILRGEYDTAVPASYTERAAENLANGQYVIFPGFGHVVLGQEFNPEGTTCGQRLLAQFLEAPTTALDTSCLAELDPPF